MRRARLAAAGMVVLVAFATMGAASAAPSQAPAPAKTKAKAWFRMAHFATDVPPVDLYLEPQASGAQSLVLKGLAYGGVSPYLQVTPGVYKVNVRLAGEAATSPPAFSGSADVVAGNAYTFAAFGTAANLTQRLLTDDLTEPWPGQARARLVQAADVPVRTDVLGAADPATITAYTTLPAGRPLVKVTADGAPPVTAPVTLDAGSIHSVIVLRQGSALALTDVVDTFTADGPAPGGNAAGGTVVAGAGTGSGSGRSTLPRTGVELQVLAAAALGMIVLGRGMLLASRR